MKKALLVIDMQNICVGENCSDVFKYDKKVLIKNVNEVIYNNKNEIVVYIKNIMKNNFINRFAPFKAFDGTDDVELVDSLSIVSSHVFKKYKGDAFSNKALLIFLKDNGVEEVEIIGVDGGGCISLTAMGAIKNGFKVTLNTKAIGTTFKKKKEKYFKKLKTMGVNFI